MQPAPDSIDHMTSEVSDDEATCRLCRGTQDVYPWMRNDNICEWCADIQDEQNQQDAKDEKVFRQGIAADIAEETSH